MIDIFDSICNGFIAALAKEFFSRVIDYIIENKEKIIAAVFFFWNKRIRGDFELSVNHPNTPFTYTGKGFGAHL
jgi:hypothetical protein